jgi:MFS-type transporter involved in bile tolerance (Atg22 family)
VRAAIRRGVSTSRARTLALFFSCVLMSCAAPAGFIRYRTIAVGCIVLAAVGVAGFLVIYLTLVQEVEPLHVGATAGMLGGIGNLAYGLVSPYIGRLADLRETRLTFLLAGVLPWLVYLTIYQVTREKAGSS